MSYLRYRHGEIVKIEPVHRRKEGGKRFATKKLRIFKKPKARPGRGGAEVSR